MFDFVFCHFIIGEVLVLWHLNGTNPFLGDRLYLIVILFTVYYKCVI